MANFLSRMLRAPWGFPLVVGVALAGFVANEAAHRSTRKGLTESTQADQVTKHTSVANYYALDRVNALRAYLLQPHPQWLSRYREANAKLEESVGSIVAFLQRADGPQGTAAARLSGLYAARSADLERAFEHAQAQQPEQALSALHQSDASGRGVALRAELLKAVDRARSYGARSDSRTAVALDTMRWLAHALIAAMVLAAYALLRQMQLVDAGRRQHAELLEREVNARTAELRALAGHLIHTREDERGRLARELHDEMGGLLSTLKLDLARLRRHKDLPDSVRQHTQVIDGRLLEVVQIQRRVIENLQPSALAHLGLTQALSQLCRDNASAMEVPTHEDLQPLELASDLELTLYRVAQEALTNVRKYSGAGTVWVSMKTEGERVQLTVDDDGVGFDDASTGPGHHGLAGMRLRVEAQDGQFTFGPRPGGRGARVQATLPARLRTPG